MDTYPNTSAYQYVWCGVHSCSNTTSAAHRKTVRAPAIPDLGRNVLFGAADGLGDAVFWPQHLRQTKVNQFDDNGGVLHGDAAGHAGLAVE